MPNLEAMSLDELDDLICELSALQLAGAALVDAGLEPVFRLVPGERMALTISTAMPEACAAHEELFAAPLQGEPKTDWANIQPLHRAEDFIAAVAAVQDGTFDAVSEKVREILRQDAEPETMASPPAAHGADDAPPAADHGAAGGVAKVPAEPATEPELPACATSSPNGAGKGGGAADDTQPAADSFPSGGAEPPEAAPDAYQTSISPADARNREWEAGHGNTPGSSGAADPSPEAAPRGFVTGVIWTPEEDDRLVELVAVAMVTDGASRNGAARDAAAAFGRPAGGVQFRANSVLRDRITARVQELSAAAFTAAPEAAPAEPSPAEPPPAAVDVPTPVLLPAYLDSLPRKGGWSLDRDADVMRLACLGWTVAEIATDLGLRADQVKQRFDLLTGHHKTDAGWTRRFTREEVFAVLETMQAGEGK